MDQESAGMLRELVEDASDRMLHVFATRGHGALADAAEAELERRWVEQQEDDALQHSADIAGG